MSDKTIFGVRIYGGKVRADRIKSGTEIMPARLYDVLKLCMSLPDDGNKGYHGAIWTYDSPVMGADYFPEDGIRTAGVIFCDIDNITKPIADTIFSKFSEIKSIFPYIIGIQYSSSYYRHKDGFNVGLHVYIASENLNEKEYEYCAINSFCMLCEVIKNVCGYDFYSADLELEQAGCTTGFIIDKHNSKITQRFLLYYSNYIYDVSDNQPLITKEVIDSKEFDDVKTKYSNITRISDIIYWKEDKSFSRNKESVERYNGIILDSDKRWKVDHNFRIYKYAGNECRWRIANVFNHIFEDPKKAQEECDKHFYFENSRSIWSKVYKDVSPAVIGWLEDNGIIKVTKKKTDTFIMPDSLEVKSFLSEEYYDFIKNEIDKHKSITIQGDTGIGKTVCISKLCKDLNGCILTPFLNMRRIYEKEGIDIVEKDNQVDFDYEKPFVCVYDRIIKIKPEHIMNRTVFIDESHVLFTDRTYRKTLIKVIDYLKEYAHKIVCISATPLLETNVFGSEVKLKFSKLKKQPLVRWTNVKTVNECKYFIKTVIKTEKTRNNYDRICVFGNMTPRFIYDNELLSGWGTQHFFNIFHTEYSNTGDSQRVIETEYLDKHYNLGTSLIFNGLNFRNNNEKILVIIEWCKYINSYWEIIQCIGRFRNDNDIYFIIVGIETENEYRDELREKAELLESLKISHKISSYNTDYIDYSDLTFEMQMWYDKNTPENVKKVITEEYGIKITEFETEIDDEDKNKYSQTNMMIKAVNEIIYKEITGIGLTDRDNKIKKNGYRYYERAKEKLNNFMFKHNLTKNDFIDLYKSKIVDTDHKKKIPSVASVIDYYERIREISIEGEEVLKEKYEMFYKANKNLDTVTVKNILRDLQNAIKEAGVYNNIYENYEIQDFLLTENCDKQLLTRIIQINEKEKAVKVQKRTTAGRKGGSIGKKCIYNGITYNSEQECAISICKSIGTVKRWIKTGKIQLL